MERVIRELRVIETDDGYRIEIKGDKEKLKGFMRGFGRHRHRGRHGFGFRGGPFGAHWGPFGFGMGPMMWIHGSPFDIDWEFEGEEDEEGEEKA